jgi:hypothetical protein
MRHVYCLIRSMPHYRRDAFFAGFKRLGCTIDDVPGREPKVKPSDILVVWNRYGVFDAQAKMFIRRGGTVIVAENGYLPMRGTKKAFALSLWHHNGAGVWPKMESRSHLLDVTLKPWRRSGDEILVLPQRGIGPEGVAMPKRWQVDIERLLRKRKFRVRQHPGTNDVKPIERDLDRLKCAVTWGSGAALKVLCEGVPVFHEFPKWIGRLGACRDFKRLDDADLSACMGDREAMLDNVSRAQWSVEEVETGEPFARLLELATVKQCA